MGNVAAFAENEKDKEVMFPSFEFPTTTRRRRFQSICKTFGKAENGKI